MCVLVELDLTVIEALHREYIGNDFGIAIRKSTMLNVVLAAVVRRDRQPHVSTEHHH